MLFGLLDPECDSTGQFGITHKQWCESNVFEIIIEIALQIHKYDYDGKNVIQTMKFGDKKLIKGFTSHLFERKNWLSKANFIQRAKSDKINWLFEECTVQDQYNYHLEAWMQQSANSTQMKTIERRMAKSIGKMMRTDASGNRFTTVNQQGQSVSTGNKMKDTSEYSAKFGAQFNTPGRHSDASLFEKTTRNTYSSNQKYSSD